MDVKITDHSREVFEALEKNIQLGLNAIGQTAEGYAKEDCPVDTGRLRNSITFATATEQGKANDGGGEPASPEDYAKKRSPEKNAVYVGTNVDYAPKVENISMRHKTGKAHFLKNSIANHGSEFEKIMKSALKD